jgi:hypothetical protein
MAKIKIKEGSTVIELEDDAGTIVFSQAFPGIDYATLEISTWEKASNPSSYKQGKLKKVTGKPNRATTN